NRWGIKPLVVGGFFHDHFNDLICIPIFVPLMVFGAQVAGLRDRDDPPRFLEIIIPLIIWSVLFEVVLPQNASWGRGMTADYKDVTYYAFGAFASSLFWAYRYRRRPG
ncbi:MAG TPA: hypothetical protein VHX68_14890, partial [Planctomycetaceae bacterium]|nr:hypothetical protein [Planctomycetaceae bacterium]